MHFSPRDVDDMGLWQFSACLEGHNRANGAEPKARPPSPEEHRARLERTKHL